MSINSRCDANSSLTEVAWGAWTHILTCSMYIACNPPAIAFLEELMEFITKHMMIGCTDGNQVPYMQRETACSTSMSELVAL